jgi:catechol 2,3-dioxygenase-like lactoylglutathione lyase family enzyme
MAVLGIDSVTLQVPRLEPGVKFYTDAGLIAEVSGGVAKFCCKGKDRPSIVLVGGAPHKRLHHISLRATDLEGIGANVVSHGGKLLESPPSLDRTGLWVEDPHGMLIHLQDRPLDLAPEPAEAFSINMPGRRIRIGRSAILPRSSYQPTNPLRLGHVLVFTPDVLKSVAFMTGALGMGLADRARDVIAFTCARAKTDHHVVAFAKSPGVGFHHASFEVCNPDEVGRGGTELLAKTGKGAWGFGRHTIGSNFFYYIQDPWGSWFEYFADMDYIEDYSAWIPRNYGMEDSLANWGPSAPKDFVHNYEIGGDA